MTCISDIFPSLDDNTTVLLIGNSQKLELPTVNREDHKESHPEVEKTQSDESDIFELFPAEDETKLQEEINRRREGLQTRIQGEISYVL